MRAIRSILWFGLLAAAQAFAADYPHGRLPEGVAPTHYRLTLTVDPRRPTFSGRAEIELAVAAPTSVVWLHGLDLKVQDVAVLSGGRRIPGRYEAVDKTTGVACVRLAQPLKGGRALLEFRYSAPFQDSPQGLYRTRVGKDWYAFTQFEATDARRAFPGFDEPRFKTPFDVAIVTAHGDRAVGNTPERRAVKLVKGAERRDFATTKPLPTYLVALAVGPLDISPATGIPANAVRATPLPLRLVATRGQGGRFGYALKEAPALIARLEQYFGSAFPYPKIDLIASPVQLGAMENAGAIIASDDLLLFGPAPSAREQSNFGSVIAHELAHQWFGDLVTPAWWDDIWLNEAFAEWMGSKIADQWRPDLGISQEQLGATLGAMKTDALRAGRPVHQPIDNNLQIGSTFDDITYQKGAGVIGMVESYLGEQRFQKGVQLHLSRHPYGTATANEFFAAMGEASGEPAVVEAFRSFVDQPGVPIVSVTAGAGGALALEQSRYKPLGPGAAGTELWKIPFCASVYGREAPLKLCTLLGEKQGTLALPPAAAGGVVHPDAGGAGYYRFALGGPALAALLPMGPKLPAREALALADNAGAAFEAGRLSMAELLAVARVLATHPDRTTALSLGYRLADLHDRLADGEARTLIERTLVRLYGERLRALGTDLTPGRYKADPAEQQLLRRELVGLVAFDGHDRALLGSLAAVAERTVDQPESVDALLRRRVYAAGALEFGTPFVARLKTLATTSHDAQVRRDAGFALGFGATPETINAELTFLLDAHNDVSIGLTTLFLQLTHPESRPTAWQWLLEHEDAVLARFPAMFQGVLASAGGWFCSAEERSVFDSRLGARLLKVDSGELEVGRTRERIDNCAALREATGASLAPALSAFLGS